MKHFASLTFWHAYDALPSPVRQLADRNYGLLKRNPQHPSLHLKKAGRFWSVRIGLGHRALGVDVEGGVLWFWIGSHEAYERLIARQGR